MTHPLRVHGVGDSGIELADAGAEGGVLVEVRFDQARIWSFWFPRDVTPTDPQHYLAEWPPALRRYLDGRSRVTVLRTLTGASPEEALLWDAEVQFGTAERRIEVVSPEGSALGIDKSGRLVPTFESSDPADIERMLDSIETVLGVLERGGVEPFVAYGTMLGAVRDGEVIGHDSDADLAYVSQETYPVDVIRESYRLQRAVVAQGFETIRYSGATFKVLITEADGFVRGLDVFAGFFDGPRLFLMGEVGVPFEREWLHPLGTASLHGRRVPVPAHPERLLEAKYGAGWRVPDPAFRFETSAAVRDLLSDWFRGQRHRFKYWSRRFAVSKKQPLKDSGSACARAADALARDAGCPVVDVGAGRGSDARWLARRGHEVTAYDVIGWAQTTAEADAEREGLRLEVRTMNLLDVRSVLGEGARVVRGSGPRVVMANHLLDALGPRGASGFARFCAFALRGGGELVTTFFAHRGTTDGAPDWVVGAVDTRELTDRLRAAGAREVWIETPRAGQDPPVVTLRGTW